MVRKSSKGCPNWADWKIQLDWVNNSKHFSNISKFESVVREIYLTDGCIRMGRISDGWDQYIGWGIHSKGIVEFVNGCLELDTPLYEMCELMGVPTYLMPYGIGFSDAFDLIKKIKTE